MPIHPIAAFREALDRRLREEGAVLGSPPAGEDLPDLVSALCATFGEEPSGETAQRLQQLGVELSASATPSAGDVDGERALPHASWKGVVVDSIIISAGPASERQDIDSSQLSARLGREVQGDKDLYLALRADVLSTFGTRYRIEYLMLETPEGRRLWPVLENVTARDSVSRLSPKFR